MPSTAARQSRERVDRRRTRVLVLLHVLVVRERKALMSVSRPMEVAVDATGLAAHQLGEVRVLLLRHDRDRWTRRRRA